MTRTMTYEEKIVRSEQIVRESYLKASDISQLVEVRDARTTDEDFLRIYKRTYIPKEWFVREDFYSDLVFRELGSGIALGEKKFFIGEILRQSKIKRETCSDVNFTSLVEKSRSLFETGANPTVLFAPIEYYIKFHLEWYKDPSSRIESPDSVIISGHRYKICWSNKYMPFNEFIFVDRRFGEWVYKPSFSERLYVKISESDKIDQLDLLVYTTVKLGILDPSKIAIIQTS